MVPTGVVEREEEDAQPAHPAQPALELVQQPVQQPVAVAVAGAAVVPASVTKTLRSHTSRAGDGSGASASASSPGGGGATPDAGETEAVAGRERRRGGRRGRKSSDALLLEKREERIKRRVKYLLIKMRTDRNLLDVYSREGWKGQSREKIRPVQELKRAEAQILRSKLAIREAIHELDDMGLEGSLDDHLFDDEGRIYHEEIFCAKCKSQEALLENDIILCDGACNRGFHQYCLDPPLETKDIPPGDEGWFCPACECKMECVEAINGDLGTKYEVESSWKDFFAKEAAGGLENDDAWHSSESEDDDFDPEDSKESPEAAGGVTQVGIEVDWPSTDSEDDDFDPERGEKQGGSEEGVESESKESGDDEEDGENSDSDSDFRENEAASGLSDKDEQEPSVKDEPEPSGRNINLKKLARIGKRRRSSSYEESGSSQSSDSDISDVSLVDEFKDGGAKLRRRESKAEPSAADEDAMVIEGKRHRKALDYKKLHDEMYGSTEVNDDDSVSEDEDWGPKRRRKRTSPDDPSRPRPPRVRRRNSKASKGVDADTSHAAGADISRAADADTSQAAYVDTSAGVHVNVSKEGDADASKVVDADGVPMGLPSGSRGGDGGADTPGEDREKRMWRRLPDTAVEVLRRAVAVTTLPSKSRKEQLAAELGLSFAQVHGWFKNQRHQALKKGIEKPKRPNLVVSSSKGVNDAVTGVGTSTSGERATEITIPQNENSSNTILTEKLNEEQSRLLQSKGTLSVFEKDSVLVVGADGRTSETHNNFANGGIGLPENENRVVRIVIAPAATEGLETATCGHPN